MRTTGLERRRFLSICAGAAGSLMLGGRAAAEPLFRWRGTALGAAACITLRHPEAARVTEAARSEISRLEAIFSLYRVDSALMRLNASGRLEEPPFELIEVLSLCAMVNGATDGLFDPTVQPLWSTYAAHHAAGHNPDAETIASVLTRVGWHHVDVSPAVIAFAHAGMAMTLNGIAQGYIADRVTALLRAEGLSDVLVDTGEMRAIGGHPDGGGWPVAFADDAGSQSTPGGLRLRDCALASSAPLGTVFDAAGEVGHILHPRTGRPAGTPWRLVSITSPSAAIADALSTAFCLMTRAEMAATLSRFPAAKLVRVI